MRRDLIEAYTGVHETDLRRAYEATKFFPTTPEFAAWREMKVTLMIISETPKERLDTYLQWNGILGFTSAIFAIATGET